MEIIEIDPKECTRWKLADRSSFEFGDIFELSQDILKNGQIEPVLLRKTHGSEYAYEVIAGSRRWKACLDANIPLKGIVQELSDEQAAIAQIKENQQIPICDYSKGIYYGKILKECHLSHSKLADSIGCSKAKLENFLSFGKVPSSIWDSIGNLSRVSSRSSSTILALSKKGKDYVTALIDLAEEIRKGIGSRTLEAKVSEIVEGGKTIIDDKNEITLPSGKIIGKWTRKGIQFSRDVPINQDALEQIIVQFFDNPADLASADHTLRRKHA